DSVQCFARALPRNPRKIKRFINQYRLLAYIADRRGLFEKRRVDLDGLGSIVVLVAEYPEVYSLLSTHNFAEKLRAIIKWVGGVGRSSSEADSEPISRYGLVPNKD